MPTISKEHVIAKYRHKEDMIDCKCGWAGTTDAWNGHKSEMRTLKRTKVLVK